MELKPLNASISVAPQIGPEHVPVIAAAGFRSIICNRPDGEEQTQAEASDVEAAAKAAGLDFAYVPAVSGALPPVYWHGMLKGREWMVKPHKIGA